MSPEYWQRVRKLFDEAFERPEAERVAFVQEKCADDPEARDELLRLLDAHGRAQSFLQRPPLGLPRVGRYVISREIGRGAMGIVYDAFDPLIARNVAVKIINLNLFTEPGAAEFMRDRLIREARSAGRLFHPGIVQILDVGQEGDMPFIAMERVEGHPLNKVVTDRKLSRTEVVDILGQTSLALDFAHRNGVIHRDIKPSNILFDKDGRVKVTDFGVAKLMSTQHQTVGSLMMGTPNYMSPEQIAARPVDGRSDQFSLAIVAYELLTGCSPFHADSLAALAHAIVYGERASACAANPELPVALDPVLQRGMAMVPEQRYRSCEEFSNALRQSLQETPLSPVTKRSDAKVTGLRPATAKPVHWPRLRTALGILATSLAITMLVRWYLNASPVTGDRPLGLAETVVVFAMILLMVAVLLWLKSLLRRR